MTIARRVVVSALVIAAGLGLTGCASAGSLSSPTASTAPSSGAAIVVGSANFPESVIIAHIYGGALAAKGYAVSYRDNIGDRDAYLAALRNGEIDLVPEYAGALLTTLDGKATAKTGAKAKQGIDQKIGSYGAVAYALSSAADTDSLNVTSAFAKAHGLASIGDLKKLDSFVLAANPEFGTRPDGIAGLRSLYGLTNVKFRAINDGGGNSTLKALLDDQVQVADIYSTTPSIIDNDLVTLRDPKRLFASQQVLPVVVKTTASSKIETILDTVSEQLTTEDLLELNKQVSGSAKADPETAAAGWLKDQDQ